VDPGRRLVAERAVVGSERLLLAVETASRRASAALLRGAELLAEERAAAGRSGAESLLPCIDRVLAAARLELSALSGFAVSIGPGSFTGLRVGLATVKGLAFGSDRPVAAVPTLAALARGAPPSADPVVALLDAQRGELYAAVFPPGAPGAPGAAEPVEAVYTPEALAERLPERCLLVGEGVALCGDRLRELRGPGVALGPSSDPRAADVGWLGQQQLDAGRGRDAAELVPRYVRRAEAEVRRTGRRFE
jgi:tRNA threonylcarbamoyladenosine biosynthesis protein TsaB